MYSTHLQNPRDFLYNRPPYIKIFKWYLYELKANSLQICYIAWIAFETLINKKKGCLDLTIFQISKQQKFFEFSWEFVRWWIDWENKYFLLSTQKNYTSKRANSNMSKSVSKRFFILVGTQCLFNVISTSMWQHKTIWMLRKHRNDLVFG